MRVKIHPHEKVRIFNPWEIDTQTWNYRRPWGGRLSRVNPRQYQNIICWDRAWSQLRPSIVSNYHINTFVSRQIILESCYYEASRLLHRFLRKASYERLEGKHPEKTKRAILEYWDHHWVQGVAPLWEVIRYRSHSWVSECSCSSFILLVFSFVPFRATQEIEYPSNLPFSRVHLNMTVIYYVIDFLNYFSAAYSILSLALCLY